MLILGVWAFLRPVDAQQRARYFRLSELPLVGRWIQEMTASPWPLLIFKVALVAVFLLVIVAGLFGTPIPERNIATALTWNLWWAGLIVAIFLLGSAWCGVCPWDALATWLVRRRWWRRAHPNNSLNLRVPKGLRNVWPALLMFIGLTWLELGVGVTVSPYATAALALLMVVLATVSLALFERKAFCRYFCPVGRTVGFYAQLAPVELRPIDAQVCADCTTLECYHGNDNVEPCPTHLVMGRLTQNTYCTSCGNCTQSCPHQNISWRLRPQSLEAISGARPHWDEAWFMLGLLALTSFHGLTMMPFWEIWMSQLAQFIGDSGQLLWSFTIGLLVSMAIPAALYASVVAATGWLSGTHLPFKRLFSGLAFVTLPLAFAYHLAHNLNHLVRESGGVGALFLNPLGEGAQPMSAAEKHLRHMDLLISQDLLFALQAGLIVFGFWIALKVLRHRGTSLLTTDAGITGWQTLPMLLFITGMTVFNLWLLMQPMVMRM
ncbi:MAG: 4Fe-4S binding protein [Pseudomonadota bacterium]